MARACSVCSHRERAAVDQALLAGTSMRDVAGQFSIGKSSLSRHVPHIHATVRAAQETTEHQHVLDVGALLATVHTAGVDALRQARRDGDVRAVAIVCNSLLRLAEFGHQLDVEAQTAELWARVEALEQLFSGRNGEVKPAWRNHSVN